MHEKKPCNLSCNLLFFKEIKTAKQNKGYIHMYTGIIVNHFLCFGFSSTPKCCFSKQSFTKIKSCRCDDFQKHVKGKKETRCAPLLDFDREKHDKLTHRTPWNTLWSAPFYILPESAVDDLHVSQTACASGVPPLGLSAPVVWKWTAP